MSQTAKVGNPQPIISRIDPGDPNHVIIAWPPPTMRAAAMWYASLGLKILPLWWITRAGTCACGTDCGKNFAKHPDSELVPRGLNDASADMAQIEAWWTKHPKAFIGLAMQANGLAAVDIDPGRGGNELFAELERKHGPIRSNLTQRSGSGGRHVIFGCDPAIDLAGDLGTGVDLKHKGYLVAAPSGHRSGGTYRWEDGCSPFDSEYDALGGPPPALPKWITAVPKGDKTVSDKTIREALKRFHEDEPDELKAFDYEALKAKEEEFRLIVENTSPDDYSTHRFNAAKCLCREFVRHGFTAWHLRDFYAEWDGAGAHVDRFQHGPGEYTDRDVVREFEGNKDGKPITTGEAFGVVEDDDEPSTASAPNQTILPKRMMLNAADIHGTSVKIVDTLMKRGVELYRRGDRLASVVVREPPKELHVEREGAVTAQIVPIEPLGFLDVVSRHITFLAPAKPEAREVPPPRLICDVVLATVPTRPFPEIRAVLGSPILRKDGTIVSRRGYDAASGIFLTEKLDLPPIPDAPTREDALDALAVLADLISEFPFETEAHRSVALASIITTSTRASYPVVPAIILSAPTPGTGKSFLADVIALIATGRPVAAMSAGRDEAETEKRLDAALLRGFPIIAIDNLNGTIGGDKLCQVIERSAIDVRPLGRSVVETIENTFCVLGNGNNIELSIDIARRCLMCRLDSNLERPELRKFEKRPDELIRGNRGHYIGAVLTIIKAWRAARAAGARPMSPRLASFEAWSDTVRSALVWLGQPDPCETMEEGRQTDPGLIARQSIFPVWYATLGDGTYSAEDVINKASEDELDVLGGNGLMSVLRAHMPEAKRGDVGGDVRRLGLLLRSSKGLVASGFKLEGHKTKTGVRWRVRKL